MARHFSQTYSIKTTEIKEHFHIFQMSLQIFRMQCQPAFKTSSKNKFEIRLDETNIIRLR